MGRVLVRYFIAPRPATQSLHKLFIYCPLALSPARLLLGSVGTIDASGDGAKIDFDLGLRFDPLIIDVSGRVAPVTDSPEDVRKKAIGAVERLHIADVAVFIDGRFDGNGTVGHRSLLSLGINP